MRTRATFPFYLAIVCASVACGCNSSSGGSGAGGSVATGGKSGTGGAPGGTGGSSASTGGSGAVGTSSSGGSNTTASGGRNAGGAVAGGALGTGGSTGSGTAPPSCQSSGPGRSDCGASGESCCTSVQVPGGTFYRTYTNDGSGAQKTADPATISDFRLDKYLVTVGRFRHFVAAWDQGSGYTPGLGSGKHTHLNGGKGLADSGAPGPGVAYEAGWIESYNNKLDLTNDTLQCQSDLYTWTSSPGGNEKLPMNCINWFEAYAFCIWDGGFLASEAEYVYAAAGGSEQRRFPWGSTAPGKANQYAIWNCDYPDGSGTCDGTIRNIAPVGSAKLGAGRWGQLDLVGEMIEWYLDWFAPSYATPCTDCADLADGSGRAPRDGYFGSTDETLLQSSYRNNGFYPANRFYSYGFRCARTP
jgi:formylglycine-generating enzyme